MTALATVGAGTSIPAGHGGRAGSVRTRAGTVVVLSAIAIGALAVSGCTEGAAEARTLDAACAGGDAAACNDLGDRLRTGNHVLSDWRRASELFDRACEGGEGEGCVRLARLHVHSRAERRGVTRDSALAETLFERGCHAGAMIGCTELGDMILAKDSLAAADSTTDEEAAMRGAPDSRSEVAVRAAALYRRACDGDEMTACTRLGVLYGHGRGVERDPVRAAELHRRSCDGGAQRGCTHLGLAYETGEGVEPDPGRAASLYEDACETEMAGCHHLAVLYTKGVGVARDYERAVELFDDACYGTVRDGRRLPAFAGSCFRLGDMLANGTGVERDLYDAARYFRRACALGIEEACRRSS